MTFDPYRNRIITGLLTAEELQALKDTGGPWECTTDGERWFETDAPRWMGSVVYRANVKPPQPVVRWVNEYSDGFSAIYATKKDAERFAHSAPYYIRTRRVVIE